MELKTPLYETHVKYKGKIVPFAGYLLPVQYESGVINEHMAVRTKAGLFDVSHMGEIMCTGKDARTNLNLIMTNDFTSLKEGQARYSPMCNEEGGVVDDLIIYKYNDEKYLIVVNASNREKDFKWMQAHRVGEVLFDDISDSVGQVALQGPNALEILKKITAEEFIPEKNYTCVFDGVVAGVNCIVSRTGYTGEDGFEIYMANEDADKIWEALIEAGKDLGLIPCGLGARDTLRLEAGMPLYGHEMDDTIDPLTIGLGFAVKMNKDTFIGKEALEAKKPLKQKRVGMRVTGRGIVREHEKVFSGDKEVGHTTSGTHCPFLGYPVAMAILDMDYTEVGTELEVEVRGRRIKVETVALPFYKKGQER